MNEILKQILKDRNIGWSTMDMLEFLNPSSQHLISDKMHNIYSGLSIVQFGITTQSKFGVYFDCDVDGIAAGTIMYKYLQKFNINPIIIINKGKKHDISSTKVPDDIDILIIVDSLLSPNKYNEYKEITNKDIKIIILDHHDIIEYPVSACLISSNKEYDNPALSGAGVVLKFCMELDLILGTKKYAYDFFDLAVCGIIGDVSDMCSMENRAIAAIGFQKCNNVLLKHMTKDIVFNSKFVIWVLTPLINSLCRANQNELAVKLFMSNKEEIKVLLKEASKYKKLQNEIIEEMELVINKTIDITKNIIIKTIPLEYINYSGLIASKLNDKYNKPTIIIAFDGNCNMFKGSIRGQDIDLKGIINKYLSHDEYCLGHIMAAGIGFKIENYDYIKNSLYAEDYNSTKQIEYDAEIDIRQLTTKFINTVLFINKITGKNFKPIKFKINNITLDDIMVMKEKHLKFIYYNIEFIQWNNVQLYKKFFDNRNININVIGEIEVTKFAGKKRKQFIISDVIYNEPLNFRM